MRRRTIVLSLAAVVIVALVVLSLIDHLLVDYLWYGRLGFGGVFNTTVAAEIAIFPLVWVASFIAVLASGLVGIGNSRAPGRLRAVRPADGLAQVNARAPLATP